MSISCISREIGAVGADVRKMERHFESVGEDEAEEGWKIVVIYQPEQEDKHNMFYAVEFTMFRDTLL